MTAPLATLSTSLKDINMIFHDSLTVYDRSQNVQPPSSVSQILTPLPSVAISRQDVTEDQNDCKIQDTDTHDDGQSHPMYMHATILDGVEYIENYRPGGLLPITLGDRLLEGRHYILHKLGHGASSTIWLARDTSTASLVTLKAVRVDATRQDHSATADLEVPRHLTLYIIYTNQV